MLTDTVNGHPLVIPCVESTFLLFRDAVEAQAERLKEMFDGAAATGKGLYVVLDSLHKKRALLVRDEHDFRLITEGMGCGWAYAFIH